MRLLVTIDTWDPIGGSERYARAIAPALAARGHDVTLVAARAGTPPPAAVTPELVPAYAAARPTPADRAALAAAVERARPDAALVLSASSPRAFEALAAAVRPARLVRFVQDHTPFCPGLDKMHADGTPCATALGAECLRRVLLGAGCVGLRREHHGAARDATRALARHLRALDLCARADRVLVASRYMAGELARAGVPRERTAVVPYFTTAGESPAGPSELPAATEAFLAGAGPPLVLTPARLAHPDKGVDHLLTALSKLDVPFRAVVAGDGPAAAWLRGKASDEGLATRVHFAGWLGSPALAALYARARVVCVPSVWDEPFGLVGIEAMASGLPVVAFRVGGIPEWLDDGVTGALVPRGDADSLASGLGAYLADAALAERHGAAGRTRVERDFRRGRHVAAIERALGL